MDKARRVVVALLVSALLGPTRPLVPAANDAGFAAAVQDLLEVRKYEATQNGVGLQAPNRARDLRSDSEPTGMRVVDRDAVEQGALLALRVSGPGRDGSLARVRRGEGRAPARAPIMRRSCAFRPPEGKIASQTLSPPGAAAIDNPTLRMPG